MKKWDKSIGLQIKEACEKPDNKHYCTNQECPLNNCLACPKHGFKFNIFIPNPYIKEEK